MERIRNFLPAVSAIVIGVFFLFLFRQAANRQAPFSGGCTETDTLLVSGEVKMHLHIRACKDAGEIEAISNKPIFRSNQTSRIMSADYVAGLDAIGYGIRGTTDADARTCKIKYVYSSASVMDTLYAILNGN